MITSPAYLYALGVTVAVETPIVSLAYPGERLRMALWALAATTLSHVVMHLSMPMSPDALVTWLVVGEISAVVGEALVYAAVSRTRAVAWALAVSLVANGASFSAGWWL